MKKLASAGLATMLLGGALVAQPAQATCVWNGAVTVCKPNPRHETVIIKHRAPRERVIVPEARVVVPAR